MNLNDYKIFINGQPVKRSNSTDDLFPDTRSKNQKKKDRKEYYRQKRKMRGSLIIELPMEKQRTDNRSVKSGKEKSHNEN